MTAALRVGVVSNRSLMATPPSLSAAIDLVCLFMRSPFPVRTSVANVRRALRLVHRPDDDRGAGSWHCRQQLNVCNRAVFHCRDCSCLLVHASSSPLVGFQSVSLLLAAVFFGS